MAGNLTGTGLPIEIIAKNGDTVDVRFKQTWKSDSSISWMAVQFTDSKSGSMVCSKKNEVDFGLVDYSGSTVEGPTYSNPIRVKCSAGIAKINIFVHDGSSPFAAQPVFTVPSMCYPSSDYGKKIGHYYSVPCQDCVTVLGAKPTSNPTKKPTKRPTLAPVKAPTKSPTNKPTIAPVKAPTRSPTKSPTKTPTKKPTLAPVKAPTKAPTKKPTKAPTKVPTKAPTKKPSLAPVKAPTKAPTKKPTSKPTNQPTKQPTKVPTKKPTKAPTKAPTKQPTKQPVKPPSKPPTRKPTSKPTYKTCPNSSLVSKQGTINYPSNPIYIIPGSQTGTTVQFSVKQVWKSSSISWIAVRYTNTGGSITCPKEDTVFPGVTDFCTGPGTVLTAKCSGGVASVTVYVHDGQFDGQPDFTVPAECNPSSDYSKKISYTFSIPCTCP